MEIGNGDDVPGITGHGADVETGHVPGEAGDDHFDNLVRKLRGRRRTCR